MKILLKSRHLSPIYGNRTPIAPESEDMMVIDDVPDIFHAGHVQYHRSWEIQGNAYGKLWSMAKTDKISTNNGYHTDSWNLHISQSGNPSIS